MKFKSLTMRIWVTFTAIILAIIIGISLFYVVAYRMFDENTKMKDLLVAHNILLNRDFSEPIRFDMLQNLHGSAHFIYLNGEIIPINRPPGEMQPPNNNLPAKFKGIRAENWLSTYAQGNLNEKQFKESYKGIKYMFVISSRNGGYLISYMPIMYDNKLLYIFLLIGGLFIFVGFIVAKLVANYISKPLAELEKFTKRVAAKNFKEPIEITNEDEIGRLAQSMNKMQEDLKRADEEEKKFLQSISHDLKTPVMVIMSHADALIDGIYVESPANTAQIIKDEAIRLNKKIKHLLYLNTLDYVLENQTEEIEIDLGEAVNNIIDKFSVMGSNITWNRDIESVKICGNSEKLIVAIENIFDNALRYAKTKIDVSLKQDGNKIRLEIFNDGIQIKSENIDKIFNNLYKDKTGNFGLGLAITKKIVSHYGGTISALNKDDGVCFVIEFEKS